MRVVVVGLGYVGSVCSACLADRGHDVVGVDTSAFKVDAIRRGESPIVEKGLPELIGRAVREGRLTATTRIAEAMPGADIVLVCVGTPSAEDGSLDLTHVKRPCAEVGTALRGGDRFVTVVMRSTMLPGSVLQELAPVLAQASGGQAGREFGVGYNPEFLREGTAVDDSFGVDDTILGAGDSFEDLQALARELRLGDACMFTGRIPDADVERILATADVCVSPDAKNPLNDVSTMNKVLEYMACAKPVVCFDLGEHRYSAGDGALDAEPNRDEDLADKIAQLLDDAPLRARLGERNRRQFLEELAWEHNAGALIAAYERTCGKPRA